MGLREKELTVSQKECIVTLNYVVKIIWNSILLGISSNKQQKIEKN